MTLVDSGPIIGLLDKTDPYHETCTEAAAELPAGPMLTTWSCFTEAMYLLGRAAGAAGQAALWNVIASHLLQLHTHAEVELKRMAELMHQSRDLPMDLADASLVALAESIGVRKVFALDGHFRVYQLKDGSYLEVVPGR